MDQKEHWVHTQTKGQERDNLRTGSIEADTQYWCHTQASAYIESNQEDAT